MRFKETFSILNKDKRRGSTFILVLAILSLLVLITSTLAIMSRVEINSASNYSTGVQSRLSAFTGISIAAKMFKSSQSNLSFQTSNASVSVLDEAGKININTADKELLAAFFTLALNEAKITFADADSMAQEIVNHRYGPDGKPGATNKDDNANSNTSEPASDGLDNDKDGVIDNPEEKYCSINADGIDNNLDGIIDNASDGIENDGIDNDGDGVIDEKGEGIDEPDEFIPDPRIIPNGDDTPFASVEELKNLKSFKNDLVYNATAPYLTTVSVDLPYNLAGGKLKEKIPINALSAKEIYQRLLDELNPTSDTETLAKFKQYAVNLVDYRDRDNIPGAFPDASQKRPILGVEKTPYIYEVFADSPTETKRFSDKNDKTREENDDGEYIELYNPYSEEISLSGWRLYLTSKINGNNFEHELTIPLEGKIAPKGFVIITDDYNEDNDPSPEDYQSQYGSFLGIFGKTKSEPENRIIEDSSLEIPNSYGIVYLADKSGNIIDYFEYADTKFEGSMKSAIRINPSVRIIKLHSPSPFELVDNEDDSTQKNIAAQYEESLQRDCRFASEADVLNAPMAYSVPGSNVGKIYLAASLLNYGNNGLNVSLADKISVKEFGNYAFKISSSDYASMNQDKMKAIIQSIKMPKTYGKINLNTASPLVIQAVIKRMQSLKNADGSVVVNVNMKVANSLTNNIDITKALLRVEQTGSISLDKSLSGATMLNYNKLSDLFRSSDVFTNVSAENYIPLVNFVYENFTTSSFAFSVISQNNPSKILAGKTQNRIAIASVVGIDNSDLKPEISILKYKH